MRLCYHPCSLCSAHSTHAVHVPCINRKWKLWTRILSTASVENTAAKSILCSSSVPTSCLHCSLANVSHVTWRQYIVFRRYRSNVLSVTRSPYALLDLRFVVISMYRLSGCLLMKNCGSVSFAAGRAPQFRSHFCAAFWGSIWRALLSGYSNKLVSSSGCSRWNGKKNWWWDIPCVCVCMFLNKATIFLLKFSFD